MNWRIRGGVTLPSKAPEDNLNLDIKPTFCTIDCKDMFYKELFDEMKRVIHRGNEDLVSIFCIGFNNHHMENIITMAKLMGFPDHDIQNTSYYICIVNDGLDDYRYKVKDFSYTFPFIKDYLHRAVRIYKVNFLS
jgi:hypothetical protein